MDGKEQALLLSVLEINEQLIGENFVLKELLPVILAEHCSKAASPTSELAVFKSHIEKAISARCPGNDDVNDIKTHAHSCKMQILNMTAKILMQNSDRR